MSRYRLSFYDYQFSLSFFVNTLTAVSFNGFFIEGTFIFEVAGVTFWGFLGFERFRLGVLGLFRYFSCVVYEI